MGTTTTLEAPGCQSHCAVVIKAPYLTFLWYRDDTGLLEAGGNLGMEW